jgi:hypothetical protein
MATKTDDEDRRRGLTMRDWRRETDDERLTTRD